MHPGQSRSWFVRFTKATSRATGNRFAFGAALLIVIAWLVSGPIFHWSDTWQLVINTGTTIVTFLMVFLIQSTQNRDAEAVQIKLDELLRATAGAHNALLDLEELEERELDRLREVYCRLADKARKDLRRGIRDTGAPELPRIPGKDSHSPEKDSHSPEKDSHSPEKDSHSPGKEPRVPGKEGRG